MAKILVFLFILQLALDGGDAQYLIAVKLCNRLSALLHHLPLLSLRFKSCSDLLQRHT
jgi:hypothetical protein